LLVSGLPSASDSLAESGYNVGCLAVDIVLPMHPINANSVTGIILSGGQARRMQGQDKGLLPFQGRPLIVHVIERISRQLGHLCINANRHLNEYRHLGYPVFGDDWPDYQGPLAGFYSALQHCAGDWFCIVPCDTPFLPTDLVARLILQANQSQVPVVSVSDGRHVHGTVCLFHRECEASLLDYYQRGEHRVQEWITSRPHALVDYSDQADAFLNINLPQQLELHSP
jgi:molybdopterin-guanine dinucleotide biosynthesis protein A